MSPLLVARLKRQRRIEINYTRQELPVLRKITTLSARYRPA
jgi:hypothetical protein